MTIPICLAAGGLADLPAVMAVMETAFDPRFGEAWTNAQCAGLMSMPGVWLTVARDGGDTLGFSLARTVADEAELLLLAVRPDSRRRGIGRSLLQHFQSTALDKGAEHLHLEVRDGNQAVSLYNESGFTVVGRRRAYYNGGDGSFYDALSLGRTARSAP